MKLFNYTRCLCLSFSLLVLASCNVENPIDGEQYIKQVYKYIQGYRSCDCGPDRPACLKVEQQHGADRK